MEIVQHMYPIVQGWIELRKEWEEADEFVAAMPTVDIGDYSFLVSIDVERRGIASAAKKRGLDGTVFWNNIGCGITSFDTEELNLSHFRLDGWFAHSKGFVFAYGTRKSPKGVPPPQFKTVEEFIEYLKCQEVFYTGEE